MGSFSSWVKKNHNVPVCSNNMMLADLVGEFQGIHERWNTYQYGCNINWLW